MGVISNKPSCGNCSKSIDDWMGVISLKVSPSAPTNVMDLRVFCDACYRTLKIEGSLDHWKDYARLEDFKDDLNSVVNHFMDEKSNGARVWCGNSERSMQELIRLAQISFS